MRCGCPPCGSSAPRPMALGKVQRRRHRRRGHLQHRIHVYDHQHVCEDNNVKLNAINAGPTTTDCMVYQYKYNTIRYRDPKEVGWAPRPSLMAAPRRSSPLTLPRTTPRLLLWASNPNFVLCAFCTTNNLGSMAKAIRDKYDIHEALMTTVHAMSCTGAGPQGHGRLAAVDGRSGRGGVSQGAPRRRCGGGHYHLKIGCHYIQFQ